MKTSSPFLRQPRGDGFTFIEIILVVAVVLVLFALAIPSVQKGIVKSREIQCARQLRQLGAAVALYQGENNGAFPPALGSWFPQVPWNGSWYEPNKNQEMGLAAYVGGNRKLIELAVCPLNRLPVNGKTSTPYPYAVNYYVFPTTPVATFPIRRLAGIPQPSKIVVMTDSATGSGWGYGFNRNTDGTGFNRVAEPHSGRTNILWADGHVAPVKKSELQRGNIDFVNYPL